MLSETEINRGLDPTEEGTKKRKNRLKEKIQITAQRGKKMENIKDKLRNREDSIRRTNISIIKAQAGENAKSGGNSNP